MGGDSTAVEVTGSAHIVRPAPDSQGAAAATTAQAAGAETKYPAEAKTDGDSISSASSEVTQEYHNSDPAHHPVKRRAVAER